MTTGQPSKTFIGNSIVSVVGTVFAGLFSYLFHFFVSRSMSVGQYGELQSLLAVFTILSVFTTSLTNFTIKYASVFRGSHDTEALKSFTKDVLPKLYKFMSVFGLIVLLLSVPLSRYLHLTSWWGVLFALLGALLALPASFYSALLSSWEYFASVSIVQSASSFLKLVSGVFLALILPKAKLVSASFALGSLGAFFIGWFLKRKYLANSAPVVTSWKQKYFSEVNIKNTLIPIFVFSTLVVFLGNLDVLLVKNLTTAELTGIYGAFKTLGSILFTINMAVVFTLLPRLSAQGAAERMLLQSYGLVAVVSLSGLTLFYFFPELVIQILFGAKYLVFTEILWLFALTSFLLSLLMLESHVAYALHRYHVNYVLVGTVVAMGLAIHFFHSTIAEVSYAISTSLFIGFVATVFLNHIQPKKLYE